MLYLLMEDAVYRSTVYLKDVTSLEKRFFSDAVMKGKTRVMAHQLRTFAVLGEDLGLVLNVYMAAHKHLELQLLVSSGMHMVCIYMYILHTTYIQANHSYTKNRKRPGLLR